MNADRLRDLLAQPSPEPLTNALRDPAVFVPGASDLYGVAEPEAHHPEGDSGLHLELVLARVWEETEGVPALEASPVRMAALFHDAGKAITGCGPAPPGSCPAWRAFRRERSEGFPEPSRKADGSPSHALHDRIGAAGIAAIAADLGLRVDEALFCEFVAARHMRMHALLDENGALSAGPKGLRRFVRGVFTASEGVSRSAFAAVCRADARGRAGHENVAYPQADVLEAATAVVIEARERGQDETRALKAAWAELEGVAASEPAAMLR